jgi:hypothetical protein
MLTAPILSVGFSDVAASSEASQGTPFSVFVTMNDPLVRADSAFVRYRGGGNSPFDRVHLIPSVETGSQQWVGAIPGEALSVAGLIYRVVLFKGTKAFPGPEKRVRVRVFDLTAPAPVPKRAYTMFSMPVQTDGSAVDILRDDLGAVGIDWKLFSWSPTNSTYLSVDEFLDLQQGSAYWLVSAKASAVDLEPRAGLSTPTGSPFARDLLPGWNQVGNPFAFPVGWGDVLTASGLSFADTLVEAPWRWAHKTGKYHNDVQVLQPFTGYWIKSNKTDGSLTLQIPPEEWNGGPLKGVAPLSRVGSDGWRVQIAASAPGATDEWNVVGVSPDASPGRDAWDRSEPPSSPGPSLSLYFSDAGRDRLSVDIRPPEEGAQGHRWTFDVAKNFSVSESADPVTLRFSGIESVPAEEEVVLREVFVVGRRS